MRVHQILVLFFLLSGWSVAWTQDKTVEESLSKYYDMSDFEPESIKEAILAEISDFEESYLKEDFADLLKDDPQEMIDEDKVYGNLDRWQEVLVNMVDEIAEKKGLEERYKVLILKEPSVNAFAMSGRFLYVNVGLLAEIENLDELALVMYHEIGHVLMHHPYKKYIHTHQARREIKEGRSIGCIVGCLSGGCLGGQAEREAAEDVLVDYTESRRQNERDADSLAAVFIRDTKYSVSNGAEIYKLFDRMGKKDKITTRHYELPPWGSTHPDPIDRYATLYNQFGSEAKEPVVVDDFWEIQKEAREERLRLLVEEGMLREAVETGWHYLNTDPQVMSYRKPMLAALDTLKSLGKKDFVFGKVLLEDYHNHKEVRMNFGDLKSTSGKIQSYVCNLLLEKDSLIESHYPIDITFNQLKLQLESELSHVGNVENLLIGAVQGDEVDTTRVRQYLLKGGLYKDYAKYLLDPKEVKLDQTLFIPLRLEFDTDSEPELDYDGQFDFYDWDPFLTYLDSQYDNVKLVHKDNLKVINEGEAEFVHFISEMFNYRGTAVIKYANVLHLDPEFGNFLVRNKVGNLIAMDGFKYIGTKWFQFNVFNVNEGDVEHTYNYFSGWDPAETEEFSEKIVDAFEKHKLEISDRRRIGR